MPFLGGEVNSKQQKYSCYVDDFLWQMGHLHISLEPDRSADRFSVDFNMKF